MEARGEWFAMDIESGIVKTFPTELAALEQAREWLCRSMGHWTARHDMSELDSISMIRVGRFTWRAAVEGVRFVLVDLVGLRRVEVRAAEANLAGSEVTP